LKFSNLNIASLIKSNKRFIFIACRVPLLSDSAVNNIKIKAPFNELISHLWDFRFKPNCVHSNWGNNPFSGRSGLGFNA